MAKRSDKMGSLVVVSLVVEHFRSGETIECSAEQSKSSGVLASGVKNACRPGETRDVNGGVAEYGLGDCHRRCISCHCEKNLLSYILHQNKTSFLKGFSVTTFDTYFFG